MKLRVEPHTPVPPFEQIRAQIALQVAAGRLRPGEKLPTIRSLAERTGLSPNTIARAYRELIASGVCEAAGRRGTFITARPPIAHNVATQSDLLDDAARAFAARSSELDVPLDVALEAVIRAFRSIPIAGPSPAPVPDRVPVSAGSDVEQ